MYFSIIFYYDWLKYNSIYAFEVLFPELISLCYFIVMFRFTVTLRFMNWLHWFRHLLERNLLLVVGFEFKITNSETWWLLGIFKDLSYLISTKLFAEKEGCFWEKKWNRYVAFCLKDVLVVDIITWLIFRCTRLLCGPFCWVCLLVWRTFTDPVMDRGMIFLHEISHMKSKWHINVLIIRL